MKAAVVVSSQRAALQSGRVARSARNLARPDRFFAFGPFQWPPFPRPLRQLQARHHLFGGVCSLIFVFVTKSKQGFLRNNLRSGDAGLFS